MSTVKFDQYNSLVDLCQEAMHKYEKKTAFNAFDIQLTFEDIDKSSKDFASFLQKEAGLEKGDRCAIMLPNVLQFPIAALGGLRAGATMVCINPLYTPREVSHVLSDAEPKVLVVLENFLHVFDSLPPEALPSKIIVARIHDFFPTWKKPIAQFMLKYVKKVIPSYRQLDRFINWSAAMALGKQHAFEEVRVGLEDLAFLQYTGGTTGLSKGAMLTHGNLVANVLQATSWLEQFYSDLSEFRIGTPLPLYHIFSLTANFFTFFRQGAENLLIINPRDLKSFISDWKRYPIDGLTGVNTLFNALIHDPAAKKLPFDRLKVVLGGGMAVQHSVAEKWEALAGVPIIEAYGLTEASPAVCIHRFDRERFDGSIGYPVPGTNLRIVDENGQDLPVGEVGELWVQGPQVMQGYWKNTEQTAQVLTSDRWLKTGDLASFNEDGLVFIVDRKKDLIIVSGFNVYPNEVEDVLVSHADISECAIVGVPDVNSGETIKAIVVLEEGSTLQEQELKDYSRAHLAAYKVPRIFEIAETLPKNNIGKVLRKDLRPKININDRKQIMN